MSHGFASQASVGAYRAYTLAPNYSKKSFAMRNALLLCCCLFYSFLAAQPGELTEGDVKVQTRFIEAKREALLGKTAKAIEMFKELADDQPEMDAAWFELGRLQFAAEETDAAIDNLRKAYARRPNEVYASFLAELYEASGRHKDGAALYGELIKRNPENAGFYLARAEFLVRAQDIKGAVATYNQLEDRIGVNLDLATLKHALYLGQGDKKRAEKELLILVQTAPRNLKYRHMLAGYYGSQNDKNKARAAYRDILELEPSDVRAQLALQDEGGGKPSAGNNAALMELLGQADVDLDLKVGKLLPLIKEVARTRDAKTGEEAIALATELRRVHPDEAKASAMIGDLYFHTGQLSAAGDAYRATLDLDDSVYPVWEQLLATLYLDNQIVELRKYADDALDVFPNRPAVYVHYALGEALRANFGEAGSLLDQARLMTSGQPAATAALTELATAISGLEAGDATAKIDLTRLPGGKEGPLAFLLANGGKASALQAYDQPGNTNALFLEMLGDAQAKAGDKSAAAKSYARAKAAGSKSATLRSKASKVQ